jgi:hypothetical protein
MNNSPIAKCLLLTLVLGPAASCSSIRSQEASLDHFTVGVLRVMGPNGHGVPDKGGDGAVKEGDNVIVPFAEYRGDNWIALSDDLVDKPAASFDRERALSATWSYSRLNGMSARTKTSKVVKVTNGCVENWAVFCDLPGTPLKDDEDDVVGVALNVDKKLDNPIEEIKSAQEREKIASFVQQAFDKSEHAQISKLKPSESSIYYPSVEEMGKAPLNISDLSRNRDPIDRQLIYHFRAEKKYNKPPSAEDSSCETISAFNGWVMQDKGGALKLIESKYGLTDCDGQGPSPAGGLTLLGILTIKDRIFFVVEEYSYENRVYSILEFKNSTIVNVLTVGAGGC